MSDNAWELSKENIQPLRGGRLASAVTSAVVTPAKEESEHVKAILKAKQSEFEAEIRSCHELEDPLDPWHRYIVWVEQSFPTGGREANLTTLLEKCIKEFKNNEKWNQDHRYLDVWIKYANSSPDPHEMYKFMYKHNLCTKQPGLYINLAWEYEKTGNFLKASKTFEVGLQRVEGEENLEILKKKKSYFEARATKKLVDETKSKEQEASETEDERSVFATLKGQGKKQVATSIRVGAARKADGPGSYSTGASRPSNAQRPAFEIFDESAQPNHAVTSAVAKATTPAVNDENLPFPQQNRENDMQAGQWRKARVGKKSEAVALSEIDSKPSFQIHTDDGIEQPIKPPQNKEATMSKALSTKKEEDHVPLFLYEAPDPNKRPMYCKHLVYQGATEFSFEELRAIKIKKKMKEMELEKNLAEIERLKRELQVRAREVHEREEQTRKEQERLEEERQAFLVRMQNFQQEIMRAQEEKFAKWQDEVIKKQEEEFKRIQEGLLRKNAQGAVFKEPEPLSKSKNNSSRDASDTTAYLLQPAKGSSHIVSSKTPERSRFDRSMDKLTQPSPTVNTREAFDLVQGMWRGEEEELKEQQYPDDVDQEKSRGPQAFQIYCDENAYEKPIQKKFEIYCDENAPPVPQSVGAKLKMRERSCSPDKENHPPEGYEQKPLYGRKSRGVLEPREDVPYLSLDAQEEILDEDEKLQSERLMDKRDYEDMDCYNTQDNNRETMPPPSRPPKTLVSRKLESSIRNNPNATIALPSQKDFEEMAKFMSTPLHGKMSAFPTGDLDEPTCAIEIISCKNDQKESQEPQKSLKSEENFAQDLKADVTLSTIMETSREHNYKSTTSSSGHSMTHHYLTKSHWGNTGIDGHTTNADHKTLPSSTISNTPGVSKKASTDFSTCASGYLADNSSARTPGIFLSAKTAEDKMVPQESRLEPLTDKLSEQNNKRQKMSESFTENKPEAWTREDDDDEDYTSVANLMKNFKQSIHRGSKNQSNNISANLNPSRIGGASMCHESLQDDVSLAQSYAIERGKSFADPFLQSSSRIGSKSPLLMESPPKADLTHPSFASFCNTNPKELVESPRPDVSPPSDVPKADISSEPNSSPIRELSDLTLNDFSNVNNPFAEDFQAKCLASIKPPIKDRHGYYRICENLPQVRQNRTVDIGRHTFLVGQCQGEGSFGKVFKAMKKDDSMMNETIADMDIVLKVQKPACEWDFYIATEIHRRIEAKPYRDWFLSIPRCFRYNDGSIFVSQHHQGTLLDLINQCKSKKSQLQLESIAMYYTIEILQIVEKLHELRIIHGDIKPDNFLIQAMPKINFSGKNAFEALKPSLQLIDYGRSIDMTFFPRNKTFSHCFSKKDLLKCPEMMEGRPWSYQLDYFGIASTAYVLLSGNYMKLGKNRDGLNFPQENLKRWWNIPLWTDFFSEFLNISSAQDLPDLQQWRGRFQRVFVEDKLDNFRDVISGIYFG